MATILIGGGSGLIGGRLSELLRQRGDEVLHLSRSRNLQADFPAYGWNPSSGEIDEEAVRRADVVVNLAGAGIADRPWTEERKRLIINSRVDSTRTLLKAFQRLNHWPKAFVSSAAIGYYGDRGEEWMAETAPAGKGFLSESCLAWENAIEEVAASGIRTVALRVGIVLSTKGGALPKIAMPLNFFAAPYFGAGRQWYSWIHIDDLCRIFIQAIDQEQMKGVYNATAPSPVRNKSFMEIAVSASGKPALLAPAPAFALRLVLGEMSHTVLDSTRADSSKLQASGFTFQFPELEGALKDLWRRKI